MNNLVAAVSHHGYLIIFLIVFAESSGLPVPAAVGLVAAGAASAAHVISTPLAFLAAIVAMLTGDLILFLVGRYTGWALLGFICALSLNPESCILRSAETFYKRGRLALLFAKFVPGVNTMAPPLAGTMRMSVAQFLRLDFVGACLYILAYGALGYIFRDFVAQISRGLQTAGHTVTEVVLFAFVVFLVYRIIQYRRNRVIGVVPKIHVEELAKMLASEEHRDVIVADVRSHGYYDPGAARIAGSIRLEPNRLAEEVKLLPRDKDIFLYCT
jgi:membrane protein DedA with SNARE-associated domain